MLPPAPTVSTCPHLYIFIFFFFLSFFFAHFYFPASGQAVVTGAFSPQFLPSIFFAHRVQQSHRSSIFHQVLLTHALALSVNQFVHKEKSPRIYTSMHSAGLELTKLTYTRLEDNVIRHRGDRLYTQHRVHTFYTLLELLNTTKAPTHPPTQPPTQSLA